MLALTSDALTLRNVSRVARAAGLEVTETATLEEVDVSPTVVVIDLEEDGGIEAVTHSKTRWPEAMVVGVVTTPTGDVWKRAELAGCDVVTTRGAVARTVPDKLRAWQESPGGRRLRLFAMNDIAGRLGLVARLDDDEWGPLAAYHIGGEICVMQDVCPHAGARLSMGEVNIDDGVVTCPEHGSRFDTCTGERVRGPADDRVLTFPVQIEDGQAYVRLDRA